MQQPKPKDEHAKGSGKSSEKDSCKTTTYKLKKRPFKVEFSVDAQFESPSATEVSLHGDQWTDFEVLKAVEHGTRVRQGDVLVQLNMEKIDKLIADQQRDQSLLQLSLKEWNATRRGLSPWLLWTKQWPTVPSGIAKKTGITL